jgi:hypothetical protein
VQSDLNIVGQWSSPGGEVKQFTSENYSMKWYGIKKQKLMIIRDDKNESLREKLIKFATLNKVNIHDGEQSGDAEGQDGKYDSDHITANLDVPDSSKMETFVESLLKFTSSQCYCCDLAVISLRDKVANLSLKTSDMNTKIKDMDNERLSLITAIRLIQTALSIDINTEERQPFQTQNEIKQNSKRKQTQRQSRTSESGEPNIQLSNRYEVLSSDDDDEQTGIKSNGKSDIKNRKGQDRQSNNRSNTQKTNAKSTKSPVAILGDSMVKMLQPAKLSRSADKKVQVKTFPGATIADMEHYVQPTLRTKPRMVVLDGTNDIQHKEGAKGVSRRYEVVMPRYSN